MKKTWIGVVCMSMLFVVGCGGPKIEMVSIPKAEKEKLEKEVVELKQVIVLENERRQKAKDEMNETMEKFLQKIKAREAALEAGQEAVKRPLEPLLEPLAARMDALKKELTATMQRNSDIILADVRSLKEVAEKKKVTMADLNQLGKLSAELTKARADLKRFDAAIATRSTGLMTLDQIAKKRLEKLETLADKAAEFAEETNRVAALLKP